MKSTGLSHRAKTMRIGRCTLVSMGFKVKEQAGKLDVESQIELRPRSKTGFGKEQSDLHSNSVAITYKTSYNTGDFQGNVRLPAPAEPGMDYVTVFVHYDGIWDENNDYIRFKMCGILVQNDCSFENLIDLLPAELKMNLSERNLTIEYQVEKGNPTMKITSDSSLIFYLELKRRETRLTSYPICLTIESGSMVTSKRRAMKLQETIAMDTSLERMNSLTASENESSNYIEIDMLPDFIEFANKVAEDILEDDGAEIEDIMNDLNSKIISNPNIEEIEKGEFNEYMMKLDKIDKGIRTYLEETGFSKWARVFSRNKRYSSTTSNIAESINATNKAAKQLPIAPLLECLRSLTQR
ncbi:hypothetical protein TorRG33x02_222630 [Trema orientale]|uniref:Uncharacterized protein n=1 Tax=Trema orientale TaxID=63057 RepID=A0A2P5E8W0_TREOI|nr:hypothetical protein TorRG33x02_222630 [Trema orientale]